MLCRLFNLRLISLAFIAIALSVPARAGGWGYSAIYNYGSYIDSMSITSIDDWNEGWQAYTEGYLYANGYEVDFGYRYDDYEAQVELGTPVNGYGQDILFEVYGEHYEELGLVWLVVFR